MHKRRYIPDRYCEACGQLLVRRTLANGQPESHSVWLARHYCNRTCMGVGQHQRHQTKAPV